MAWQPKYGHLMTHAEYKIYMKMQGVAGQAVGGAITIGLLKPLYIVQPDGRKEYLQDCVDCRQQKATCYDHRDYDKPLEVDPVCRRCNKLRGPAWPSVKKVFDQRSAMPPSTRPEVTGEGLLEEYANQLTLFDVRIDYKKN